MSFLLQSLTTPDAKLHNGGDDDDDDVEGLAAAVPRHEALPQPAR